MEMMTYFSRKKSVISYILALLVFLIHLSTFANYSNYPRMAVVFNTFLTKSVHLIAVPMFFFLSGFMFYRDYQNKKYWLKLKNRFKTIVVPYLTWNLIWMLFGIVVSLPVFAKYFIGRQPVVLSLRNVIEGILHYKYNGPFWFLFCLIVFFFASPVIYFFLKNKILGVTAVVSILVLKEFHIGLPWPLFESPYSLFYYCLGGWVAIHRFEGFAKKQSKTYSITGWCILGVISIYYVILELVFGGG